MAAGRDAISRFRPSTDPCRLRASDALPAGFRFHLCRFRKSEPNIYRGILKLVLSSFGCGRVFMDDLKHVRRGRKGEYMSPRRRSSESFSQRCLPRTYLVLNNHVWRFRPSMSISVSIRIPICSLRLYFSERIFRKRRSELRARQSTDPVAIPMRTATPVLAWRWHGLTPTILFIKSKSTKSTARASYELVGASNPSRTQEVERGH